MLSREHEARESVPETNQTLWNLRNKAKPTAPRAIMVIVAGSGTGEVVASAPEILGWRRSLNPPGASIVVLTIDSPLVATIVRKFWPLPRAY